MKESIISRFLNNKIIVFIITTIQIVYLFVLYTLKNLEEQNKALLLVKRKLFLLFICGIICILSLYNVFLAVLSSITLIICISFNNKITTLLEKNEMNNKVETESTIENFENKEEKGMKRHNFVSKAFRLTKDNKYLSEYFDDKDQWKEGFNENKIRKKRERMENIKKNNRKKNSKERFINKRVLNEEEEDDRKLINTKEIFTDMINRIDYEYEDYTYLKKYISSRIEEIVDMLDLLEEDD